MIRIKAFYAMVAILLILLSISSTSLADSSSSGKILKADLIFGPDENLDPAYKYTGWYMHEAGIYETLFSLDENMNLVPTLATGFDQISDTEYTIHLRTGVKFHDGTPLNADAVVYSLERVMDSSNSRHGEFGFIESVKAVDDNTVTIKTKKPHSPTIASLIDPLVSIVKPDVDLNSTPVGTGPFKFESFEKDVKLNVVRNDDYWGDKPKLDGAVLYFVSDPMTRAMQLEGGDVDIALGIPQTEVENLKSQSDLEVLSEVTLRENLIYINMKKAPFDNLLVRQALNHAIDRQVIVDTALEGVGGIAAIGPLSSGDKWSANDDLKPYEYDPSKAKELLIQAGINYTDGDGWLDFNGKPFEITIKTYTSRSENKPSAEVVAAQLENIGIKSHVEVVESGAFSSDLSQGNYDLGLGSFNTGTTGDPDYTLSKHFGSTGSEAKKTGYSNPDVDKWLDEARATSNQDERMEYYKKVQEQIMKDSPEIILFYLNVLVGENKKVDGFVMYPSSEINFLTPELSLED
ncbi:MAG: putative ABC transporter periplasmic-binding protein [Methanosaeta sp. PtaU1.Bin112]|nr:MAG: putative ABC transporter periplasmic-binding protein [Methanosaeta sp. PtaU1.Bin112]